jgi:hypothetical protein
MDDVAQTIFRLRLATSDVDCRYVLRGSSDIVLSLSRAFRLLFSF